MIVRPRSTLIGAGFVEAASHLLDVRHKLRHGKDYRADDEWSQWAERDAS